VAGGTFDLVGREAELQKLDQFLGRADGGALVIEGEPGIGKSTLWEAGVAAARRQGHAVLACRPAGSEVQLSFAALGDLLGAVLDDTLHELPQPRRRALEVALLLEEAAGPPPDQRAIGLALLGVLRLLAQAQPVLVAIDDAQWLDRPTAAVLEFALRRLRGEPVALLVAVRIDPGQHDVGDLMRAFPADRQSRLRVEALSVAAIHRLIRSRLDVGLPRPLLLRLHETSGGNPFYALELARALVSEGGRLRPGEQLPVPGSLQELLNARTSALPQEAQDVLLAVASLSNPTLPVVRAACGALRAQSALEAAAAAGVGDVLGERVVFTHPLLASAVYAQARPHERQRMHRRLAEIVRDPEAQARHLALGADGPDEDVAAALYRAAQRAFARGAPDAAAELLELSVEATPVERERDLLRRKLEAADAHVSSGAIDRATRMLEALVGELPPSDERAAVLWRACEGRYRSRSGDRTRRAGSARSNRR
jgi:predicted ATPase